MDNFKLFGKKSKFRMIIVDLNIDYNTKIRYRMSEIIGKANKRVNGAKSLFVEVKMRNKTSETIMIQDMFDETAIDQTIQQFLESNNLKQQAFNYIKTIVQNKIKSSMPFFQSTSKVQTKSQSNKQNEQRHSSSWKLSQKNHPLSFDQPLNISINVHRKSKHLESTSLFMKQSMKNFQEPKEDLSVFSSSFTLPSSEGEKEKQLLTDIKFDNAFDTVEKHSENFSTINEIQEGSLTPARPLAFTPSIPNPPQITHKKPIKITLLSSHKKLISPNKNKQQSGKEFCIYEQKPCGEYDQELKVLFDKLIKHNPASLKEVRSRYVSYESLTKGELRVVGKFFEKIDPKELSHLNCERFKYNILSICKEQLIYLRDEKQFLHSQSDFSWF